MNDHELIALGAFVNELEHLQTKHGIWIQGAEVYTISQADPIATIGAGGGSYCVQVVNNSGIVE
jgi:hypothetical protein